MYIIAKYDRVFVLLHNRKIFLSGELDTFAIRVTLMSDELQAKDESDESDEMGAVGKNVKGSNELKLR
ncbi:hypothetical protein Ping_2007 [Psychromonas ingrahamii 37]|uniref:Uncharacterized protein n=1 Tax=Psychromonas ingrahamii (strain DSM 17664 / CCUG 51855 / 37) TaxID=357804 RepID=A1SWA6_PSYIN|nr:hypothetical protein [Psychromonas ingrahamii]ABM03771.1 hypothetical protein Ping_2007 [Psychromonas ingrahamii 37]